MYPTEQIVKLIVDHVAAPAEPSRPCTAAHVPGLPCGLCGKRGEHPLDDQVAEIRPGALVRSFDFDSRALSGPSACYIEGVLVAVLSRGEAFTHPASGREIVYGDCDRYVIRTLHKIRRGDAHEVGPGEITFTPVNGTPSSLGDPCDGVEDLSAADGGEGAQVPSGGAA